MGADLYDKLKHWFETHLSSLLSESSEAMDETLLQFYTKHWTRYTTAAAYINHIFRYLNRHWVKREIDEGHKNVYDVYTVWVFVCALICVCVCGFKRVYNNKTALTRFMEGPLFHGRSRQSHECCFETR